jgi:hypothetical protein
VPRRPAILTGAAVIRIAGKTMPAHIEVWRPEGAELVPLGASQVTIGRAASNDVAIPSDTRASRVHAVLEPLPTGWCVRDLGSRNGTFVNGDRIVRDRPLWPGDQIQIGGTRLVYRAQQSLEVDPLTEGAERPPELTPRERDVLIALLRPALSSDVFTEPASIKDIAEALVVSEAAVKNHLVNLYDKFGIYGEGERRRVRLANEAMRRGAVTLGDVHRAAE